MTYSTQKQQTKKTHKAHQNVSLESKSQPKKSARQKLGTKGEGHFYRIQIRSKDEFEQFRNQDLGSHSHTERVAGKKMMAPGKLKDG